ncbi:hypothetical protein KEM54_003378 [Ascosphaera aggregata]|nr:hypothetical protein KEM54_003378 [Ascosphaera aggregata]
MPPKSRSGNSKAKSRSSGKETGQRDKKQYSPATTRQNTKRSTSLSEASSEFEIKQLPVTLQQSILNVFKHALDKPFALRRTREGEATLDGAREVKPLSDLVQLVKAHLYRRDFEAAFADADGELLRAYALRWSAGRALAYAGIFGYVLAKMRSSFDYREGDKVAQHIVCIGGGAGSELVGLAAAWKNLEPSVDNLNGGLDDLSIDDFEPDDQTTAPELEKSLDESVSRVETTASQHTNKSDRALTIVDIADWSSVVEQLTSVVQSELTRKDSFNVAFNHADILDYSEDELTTLIHKFPAKPTTTLVTLMFTLNELFSVSIPKTTKFLLHLTDVVKTGTLLLVVDSPGSYSSVSLGASKNDEAKPQRTYPMRFLLDHTLLTIAEGRWESVVSESSRWFRRDEARLRYSVGDGIGLEDMRFQLHLYRKLGWSGLV